MRFCEKVGFFSGTDKATAEGVTSLGGSRGMLPQKILTIAMQIEAFYSIWTRIIFSLLKIDMFKGIKDLLYRFFFIMC